jgi:Zn-dependent peptidase ImmA (M78 family)
MEYVKTINRQNLRIARENVGLSTESASKKVTTSIKDVVFLWENGESLPTWSQVLKLSKMYCVSELLFFSEQLLQKNKSIPDYRVGQDSESNEKVTRLINLFETRQKWLSKKMAEEGFPKNRLQGSGKDIKTPRELAKFISETLGINLEEIKRRSGVEGRKKTLEYLISLAENQGIFVGKTVSYIKIDVKDMRGLFISNDYCPYIILNRRDATSAQIFSFIHELAHLFRKTEAISNSLDFRDGQKGINNEEIFCNKVAAELLLPENEFSLQAYGKSEIDSLSSIYKVSKIFIFYRLRDLGLISQQSSKDLETEILQETSRNLKLREAKKAKGGNHTTNMKDSNGKLFNRIISSWYFGKEIGYTEASNLLKYSVEKV